jgi:hypothetical protein
LEPRPFVCSSQLLPEIGNACHAALWRRNQTKCAAAPAWSAGSQDTPVEERTAALEYLQGIYNDPTQSTSMRMRAAIECLPFETPKLSATAVATMDGKSFADALERAIVRSQSPVPLLNGSVEELPATELKKPFSNYRNNYRRY